MTRPLLPGTSIVRQLAGRSAVALALLFLLTAPARAHAAEPRLLLTPDSAAASGSLTETQATPSLAARPWPSQFLVGAGAAVVAVPGSLLLGSALGSLSNNLFLAALPSLVLFLALPPLAVTWAEWMFGNWDSPGSARFMPAIWIALGVHAAAMVGGIASGASYLNLGSMAILTLIEALVLPAVVTLSMRLLGPHPEPAAHARRVQRQEPAPVATAPALPDFAAGRALAPPRATLIPVFSMAF